MTITFKKVFTITFQPIFKKKISEDMENKKGIVIIGLV